MKRFAFFVFLIGSIASLSYPCCAQSGEKRVAILNVVDRTGTLEYGVKLLVRGYMTDAVTNNPGYEGYDRVDISAIMNEQEFQRTGMVSDEQIKELGKMTGADYVLLLEMAKLDADNLVFTSKILEVESGHIFRSGTMSGRNSQSEHEVTCQKLANKLLGGSTGSYSRPNVYSQPRGGQDYVENMWGLNMKMVWVEGGSFIMGCTGEQGGDCDNDEKNTRRVSLTGYYIGMTEVTQGQWEKVMGTSVYQQRSKAGANNVYGVGPDYPMYYVSWEEAMAFCEELSRQTGKKYRLPTEAQWEYAARGGNRNDGTKYSGSYSIDAVAWYTGNSSNSTHIVGSKRPNGLGLYDMSGNVWEWCRDWYADSYIGYQTDNPQGPSGGSGRVNRGGGWGGSAAGCRVSLRDYNGPGYRDSGLGFRVVCEP